MIISCTNCQKKFDVKDNLIPKSGRLLECSSCKHKWFFKNDVLVLKKTTKEKIAYKDQIKEFSEDEIPKDVENIIKEAEISKVNNQKNIVCIYIGDASVEEGVFYESLNFCVVKKLPVVFICENNFYSVYTRLNDRQPKNRKIYKGTSLSNVLQKID